LYESSLNSSSLILEYRNLNSMHLSSLKMVPSHFSINLRYSKIYEILKIHYTQIYMVEKDINIEIRKLIDEGKIKYTLHEKIKIGRWILGEKIGEFIGCKGRVESKGKKNIKANRIS